MTLDQEKIDSLITEIIEARKSHEKAGKGKKTELPEYNPIYNEAVELDDKVAVHAETEYFPEKLFKSKAPNETDTERTYRKESYQPETTSVWNKGVGQTNRIFNAQNYSIDWKEEDESNETRPSLYFTKQYPLYENFITGYFDAVVRPKNINYPNSVICYKPRNIPFIEAESADGTEREFRIDDTKLLEPVAVVYAAKQVIKYLPGEYVVILLNECSWVTHGNAKVKEGLIFEVYDTNSIWRVEQTGKKIDFKFETFLYYEHGWGKLPATKLKGLPVEREGDLLYKSYFYDAVAPLNQALYDSSTLQVSKVANVFLEKWEYAQHCDAQGCVGGKITTYSGENLEERKDIDCDACHGTGWKRNGVLGVYQLKTPDRTNPEVTPAPPAGYIDKNYDILGFLRSEIRHNEHKSFLFLGIDASDTEAKGTDTALGKIVDREALFSALSTISKGLFDLLQFSFEALGFMRYGQSFQAPHINRPTNFAIRQASDLTLEISDAIKAGLPEIALNALIKEYLQTRFSSNVEKTQIADLVAAADDLQLMPQVEIASRVMTGTVAKWQDVLHVNVERFIWQATVEDKEFLNKPMEEKVQKLQEMAKALSEEIAPKLSTADDIFKNIAEPEEV